LILDIKKYVEAPEDIPNPADWGTFLVLRVILNFVY